MSATTYRGKKLNTFGLITVTVRTREVSLELIYEYNELIINKCLMCFVYF